MPQLKMPPGNRAPTTPTPLNPDSGTIRPPYQKFPVFSFAETTGSLYQVCAGEPVKCGGFPAGDDNVPGVRIQVVPPFVVYERACRSPPVLNP